MSFPQPPSEHLLRDILPDEMPANEYRYLRKQLMQHSAADSTSQPASNVSTTKPSTLRWLWLKLAARA